MDHTRDIGDVGNFIAQANAVTSVGTSTATAFPASNHASIGALSAAQNNFGWMFYVHNKGSTDLHVHVYNQGAASATAPAPGARAATLGDRVVPAGQPGYFKIPMGSGQGIASCLAAGSSCDVSAGWFLRRKT